MSWYGLCDQGTICSWQSHPILVGGHSPSLTPPIDREAITRPRHCRPKQPLVFAGKSHDLFSQRSLIESTRHVVDPSCRLRHKSTLGPRRCQNIDEIRHECLTCAVEAVERRSSNQRGRIDLQNIAPPAPPIYYPPPPCSQQPPPEQQQPDGSASYPVTSPPAAFAHAENVQSASNYNAQQTSSPQQYFPPPLEQQNATSRIAYHVRSPSLTVAPAVNAQFAPSYTSQQPNFSQQYFPPPLEQQKPTGSATYHVRSPSSAVTPALDAQFAPNYVGQQTGPSQQYFPPPPASPAPATSSIHAGSNDSHGPTYFPPPPSPRPSVSLPQPGVAPLPHNPAYTPKQSPPSVMPSPSQPYGAPQQYWTGASTQSLPNPSLGPHPNSTKGVMQQDISNSFSNLSLANSATKNGSPGVAGDDVTEHWSKRFVGNTLAGRVVRASVKSVAATVQLPKYLSPWGDNNPVTLPNVRRRDAALVVRSLRSRGLSSQCSGIHRRGAQIRSHPSC